MARNIEIKARIADRATFARRVVALAGDRIATMTQTDWFFGCANGRLKLRDFGDGHGELIAYRRPDETAASISSYTRTPTDDPDGLRRALADALGVHGRVHKTRWLYRVGRTRIHVDRVAGLGDFMELEVVLADSAAVADGEAEATDIARRLAIDAADRCSSAYVDMLSQVAAADCDEDDQAISSSWRR
ncbi:class IV adenylate cyclase [Salinisphaera sp. Q1T1-3]|uniref:class IV adenylate cyclase n=1 Tax=Salinisphaera sp. Q1T1-3 TaxID=2321229 RepID=UPI000E7391C8|nr:class IV adenylate cyclase [Salinisphaera sp. Q1T1-3]RJS92348.1 CYTH domain-containing protein [Salinisphaera sp. Q1T1-3]